MPERATTITPSPIAEGNARWGPGRYQLGTRATMSARRRSCMGPAFSGVSGPQADITRSYVLQIQNATWAGLGRWIADDTPEVAAVSRVCGLLLDTLSGRRPP